MNMLSSFTLVENLLSAGVSEWVVCAGSRNAPLIEVLAAYSKDSRSPLRIFSHFDERSASFFALGRAKSLGRPVAVLTTSGTAVSETLSALIEAEYSGSQLVIVTADRPEKLRTTGAPQTIRQNELLKSYAEAWDGSAHIIHELGQFISSWKLNSKRNLHINIQFDEPLLDLGLPADIVLDQKLSSKKVESLFDETEASKPIQRSQAPELSLQPATESVTRWLSEQRSQFGGIRPVIILSGLNEDESQILLPLLKNIKAIFYIEGPSGLRESPELNSRTFLGDEHFLKLAISREVITGVLRIGSVPTFRVWRDLENLHIPILNFCKLPFAGLSKGEIVDISQVSLKNLFSLFAFDWTQELILSVLKDDRKSAVNLEELIKKFPLSEPSFFRKISGLCDPQSFTYVGNSLPIRQWDLYAHRFWSMPVGANRGANGIDGQLASALGEGWDQSILNVILGDLTTLYDLNSLSWLHQNFKGVLRLYVINNRGGQIFSKMYNQPLYINAHHFNFKGLAEMFGLEYRLWTSNAAPHLPQKSVIIEVIPDSVETLEFAEQLKALKQ